MSVSWYCHVFNWVTGATESYYIVFGVCMHLSGQQTSVNHFAFSVLFGASLWTDGGWLYTSPKVDLKFLNYGCSAPGSDMPGKAGEIDQSDVWGAWGRAGGGPHVWPGLPSVRYLRHPVHYDTKAMSLGQRPTWQWVVNTFRLTFSTGLKCNITWMTVFKNKDRRGLACEMHGEI